ncbi:hypothetical protein [Rhodococcus sp. HS-D2]|uniref:hypothetical protein n=1 Tax=Rhodococcus sp. HS-D2 TaxID=1384636 RepID=UPI0007DA0684|nr:hypothetical protein [Rhodococcus sp. HS-D2]
MSWKNANLTYEAGTGGALRTETVQVEMSEMFSGYLRNREGFLRTRLNGVISHVNVVRIVAIDELPDPDPDEAVRAADGE